MNKNVEAAIKDLEDSIKRLEEFIPKDEREICENFGHVWISLSICLSKLEDYYSKRK